MVYYKTILDERRPRTDGIYPIVIRITFNRQNTTISTGTRVEKQYWDEKSCQLKSNHPNYSAINPSVLEAFLKVQRAVHLLNDANEFSFEALREQLTEKKPVIIRNISFYDFAQGIIKDMLEVNRVGNAIVYRTAVNRLTDFCDNKKLKFTQIDYAFLEKFKRALIKDGAKPNTVGNYFRSIRALYNKAIKFKIVDRSYYPFIDISIKTEKTAKRAIPVGQLKKLGMVFLEKNSPTWHARNYFLLSFSLIGISFTDLAYLTSRNLSDGRLRYKRRKTHKEYDIKLTDLASHIFGLYRGRNSKYLLPILHANIIPDSMEAKKIIAQWIKTTNKWLKRLAQNNGIQEEVTTYVARHTWATTAKRLGYSNEVIAEALGHEYGNKITNIYLDAFDKEVIDSLNEKVLEGLYLK